jgi:hypothetical protein
MQGRCEVAQRAQTDEAQAARLKADARLRAILAQLRPGQAYKPKDLRNLLGGGNWQSSLVYPPKDTAVLALFLGRAGAAKGLREGRVDAGGAGGRADAAGLWLCTGQGEGNQGFEGPKGAPNRALRDSQYVLLFEDQPGKGEKLFLGVARYESWDWYEPGFGPRAGQRLIEFRLREVAV